MINENSRALLVDDTDVARSNLERVLTELGYRKLRFAADGRAGITALEEADRIGAPFELILCDWMMPGMTGIEFLAHVRGTPKWRSIPFIMVTAEVNPQGILQAIKLGASDYIVKPFNRDAFLRKIAALNQLLARKAP